jgi:outer membrane protein assembly factor BamB
MPSRRSFLATISAALSTVVVGCASLPQLQPPAGTDWSTSVPQPGTLTPPSVTHGFVAVGGRRNGELEQGRVVVFDTETGQQQWQYDCGRMTGLVAADGSVYAGEKRGSHARVSAFDAATGKQRWTQTVENLASVMTVSNGTLYTAGGALAALATTDGAVRWERSHIADMGFTIVLAPDDQIGADSYAVYYGDGTGVVALSPANGSLLWRWHPKQWESVDVGPIAVTDTIYVGGSGKVVALDRNDGTVRWQTSFGRDAKIMGVQETNTSLFVAAATDDALSDTFGTVYVLSVQDGSERHEMRFDTPVAQTAATTETFIVGTDDDKLVWFDMPLLPTHPTTMLPAEGFLLGAAGRQAFAQSRKGTLWAVSPPK